MIFNSKWSFLSGEIVYEGKSQLGPRYQAELQLVYLLEGDLSVSVNGYRYELLPGEATLLLPGGLEVFHFATHGVTRHGWCRAVLPCYEAVLLSDLETRPERVALTDSMRWLTEQALLLRDQSELALTAYRDALIQAVFCEFFSQCPIAHTQPKLPEHPAVTRACAFIESHLAEPIDLACLAVEAGMTPSHLARLFRESLGVTPMRYLWRARIEAAQQLLRESGLTVAEVSYRCGFSNPQHFSKLFKEKLGQAPGSYRKSAWQASYA